MILSHRYEQERISRACGKRNPSQIHSAFNISRSNSDPKTRWIDGTPEYSYYIGALRKLFPDAQFVHIVRDVRSVVDSMLNFRMSNGVALVNTEQEAYEYWLGTVQACMRAEQAYGSEVIYRLRYEDLIQRPERTIRKVLDFLKEPYSDACLQPLTSRINSSSVPEHFDAHDPKTDRNVIGRALQLSEQLQTSVVHLPKSPDLLARVERDFQSRVAFVAGLGADYASGQRKVALLTKKLNWCGVLLIGNLLQALVVLLVLDGIDPSGWSLSCIIWLSLSSIGVGFYVSIRRAGVRELAAKLLLKCGWHMCPRKVGKTGRERLTLIRHLDV
jgi:hypothetical protein